MLVKLIDGEIYKHITYGKSIIFMWSDKVKNASYYIGLDSYNRHFFGEKNGNFTNSPNEYMLASSEEKQWLQACIYANKFIPLKKLNNVIYECW